MDRIAVSVDTEARRLDQFWSQRVIGRASDQAGGKPAWSFERTADGAADE
jgi:hypothetical protein